MQYFQTNRLFTFNCTYCNFVPGGSSLKLQMSTMTNAKSDKCQKRHIAIVANVNKKNKGETGDEMDPLHNYINCDSVSFTCPELAQK